MTVKTAAAALNQGGVIVMPTEGVYGLSCLPTYLDAVERILSIKGRPNHKGFILVAAEFEQVISYCKPLTAAMQANILPTWPGPVTWVLPVKEGVSPLLTGGRDTLAVRISDHPLIRVLSQSCHAPLVSTSANLSGEDPVMTYDAALAQFEDQVDFVLNGQLGGLTQPTSIRDGLTGDVLR